MIETRPDIIFATLVAYCFVKNLGHQHKKTIKIILQYLKGSKDWSITYSSQDELLIEGYSDSNWAGNKKSHKSILSFIFTLNGELISWCSKKQPIVALSSTETEYIVLTMTIKKTTWLWLLLTKLDLLQPGH